MSAELYLEEFMKETGGYLIGSNALDVGEIESDLDVCVLYDKLPEHFKDLLSTLDFDIRKYFRVHPKNKGHLIPKFIFDDKGMNKFVDIIIFEEEEDLEIVRSAVNDLKRLPKYMLKKKDDRIYLFELALLNYGFIKYKPNPFL